MWNTVNDAKTKASTELKEIDHIQSVVTYGAEFDVPACLLFMKDMNIKGGPTMARSYQALAACPFTQYILDRCEAEGLREFPIPLSAVYRTPGK